MFYAIGVLKSFAQFTGKCLRQSLSFNKFVVWGLPLYCAKILRTPFLIEHARLLLLKWQLNNLFLFKRKYRAAACNFSGNDSIGTFLKDKTYFIIVLLFQSAEKTFWKLLQWNWFVLKLQTEACNFFRNKLYRRHFSRKVLKQAAFLFAFLQSFCERLLKWLLWSSFFKRLKEVLSNFCRNELLCTDIFFETSWRQTQLF